MIQPCILGRGSAATAFARCLWLLPTVDPELASRVGPVRQLERGEALSRLPDPEKSVLIVASPHALHAGRLLEAQAAGLAGAVCEKPVATSLEDLARLEREVRLPVAVCHGYRMMWGPQRLRELVAEGAAGRIFAIEGHYLQSSAASRALVGKTSTGWKDDPSLSGPHDCLLDLAPHWADLALFVAGGAGAAGAPGASASATAPGSSSLAEATPGSVRLSYENAEAPHRDTRVALDFTTAGIPARSTISKNAHGSDNDLEIRVYGTRAMIAWSFRRPDELAIGEGSDLRLVRRPDARFGIRAAPFHGAGWIEGYFEVTRRLLRQVAGLPSEPYPMLTESVRVLRLLLQPSALHR